MQDFIERAIHELATAACGHDHAGEAARWTIERAASQGLLDESGPNRRFISVVATGFEDRMAHDGHRLGSFMRGESVEQWPQQAAAAIKKAWRYTRPG